MLGLRRTESSSAFNRALTGAVFFWPDRHETLWPCPKLIGATGSPSPNFPQESVARPERSGLSLVPAMTALFLLSLRHPVPKVSSAFALSYGSVVGRLFSSERAR